MGILAATSPRTERSREGDSGIKAGLKLHLWLELMQRAGPLQEAQLRHPGRESLAASPFPHLPLLLVPPVGWTGLEAGAEEPGKGSWVSSAPAVLGKQRETRMKWSRGQTDKWPAHWAWEMLFQLPLWKTEGKMCWCGRFEVLNILSWPSWGRWTGIHRFVPKHLSRVFYKIMKIRRELITEPAPDEQQVISALQILPQRVVPFCVENEVNREWKENKYFNIWTSLFVKSNKAERQIDPQPRHLSFWNAEVSLGK